MNLQALQYEVDEAGHALVTINRPEKLNALSEEVLGELDDLFEKVDLDQDVRGVILTGAGEKAFVAGADIRQFQNLNGPEAVAFAERGQRVFDRIEQLSKPVLAAINGFALGGGCELALCCHLRIASENARLGQPEVGLGIIPGYGGTQRLPRLIGPGRALEMILSGDHISATRAFGIGLVNRVVPLASLLDESRACLARITSKSPATIRLALDALRVATAAPPAAQRAEAELFGRAFETDDAKEGVEAFLEKREPIFKGR